MKKVNLFNFFGMEKGKLIGFETDIDKIVLAIDAVQSASTRDDDDEWPWWKRLTCPNPAGGNHIKTPKSPIKWSKFFGDGGGGATGGGGYLGTPVNWAYFMPNFGNEWPPESGVDPNKFCQDLSNVLNTEILTNIVNSDGVKDLNELIAANKIPGILLDVSINGDKATKTLNIAKTIEFLAKYKKASKLLYTGGLLCEHIEFMWNNPSALDVMDCYLEKNAYSENARDVASQTILALKEDLAINPNLIQDLLNNGVSCDNIIPTYNALKQMKLVAPKDTTTFQIILNCLKPEKKDGHTYFATYGVDDPTDCGVGFLNGTNPGHAFITLTEKDPSGNIVANNTFGFYPNCSPTTAGLTQKCWGQLGNDENHEVNVSWTFKLKDFDAYMSIINGIPNSSNTTWSFSYSCVTFAQQCMSNGGVSMGPHSGVDLVLTPHGWANWLKVNPCVNASGGDKGVLNVIKYKTPANKCK